jgi:hypothetical protein
MEKNIQFVGQEKTGNFVEHFQEIERTRKRKALGAIPNNSYFLLSNKYIKNDIQSRPDDSSEYGYRTNYGNKVFVKLGSSHHMVLSIPVGSYKDTTDISDMIGSQGTFNTLKDLLSYSHENALVPIELANGIASLSTYPSAKILELFMDSYEK